MTDKAQRIREALEWFRKDDDCLCDDCLENQSQKNTIKEVLQDALEREAAE